MQNQKEFFCYECNHLHDEINIQEKDCSVCEGRKCKKLHGGDTMRTCVHCGKDNLCVDCVSFARCCHDFKDGKFVSKVQ